MEMDMNQNTPGRSSWRNNDKLQKGKTLIEVLHAVNDHVKPTLNYESFSTDTCLEYNEEVVKNVAKQGTCLHVKMKSSICTISNLN